MTDRWRRYADFWPHYLHQHSMPATRACHIVGSLAALALLVGAIATARWWWLALVPVAGYGPAWLAHAIVEKNAPATFYAPLRSLAADWHMIGLWLAGRLQPELRRYHVVPGENRRPNGADPTGPGRTD